MADLSCVLTPMGISNPADALVILNAIDLLREDEGSSVTFICDNPDFNGQPNAAVICSGEWTGWQDRRFAADTVIGCLRMALAEQMRAG
jgi:hypothetical protein